jgi:hypothetical protein
MPRHSGYVSLARDHTMRWCHTCEVGSQERRCFHCNAPYRTTIRPGFEPKRTDVDAYRAARTSYATQNEADGLAEPAPASMADYVAWVQAQYEASLPGAS